MHFTVKPNSDLKIIFYKHEGTLRAANIGYVWENKLLKMPEFTQLGYHLFSDYSEAIFDVKPNDVKMIVDYMRPLTSILKGKKQSILVNDPYSTAASLLFENQVNKEIGFRVKIFSNYHIALRWLKLYND